MIREALGARREAIAADVCVIGAGIAGLVAATRIAQRSDLKVVVLESGTHAPLDEADPLALLDAVHDPAGWYQGSSRTRGIGGTSAKWAGKLLPLSAHDLGARPYLDLPAWPIEPAALARYLPEIEAMMGVAAGSYEGGAEAAPDPRHRLPTDMDDFVWRWPKRPTRANHRIDHVLRGALERLGNLTFWTDATVTALDVREGRLASVTATNHRDGILTVRADAFVVAAGTLESTRLLLLADAQNEGCVSRTTDSLGRHFNDHLGIEVAVLRSADLTPVNRALADRRVAGTTRHLHGELAPARQEAARVGSAYFDVDAAFPPDAMTSRARAAVASLRARNPAGAARHLAALAAHPGDLARALFWQARAGQQFWPAGTTVNVKLWIEQQPAHANRLSLDDRRDTLGSPRLRVDFAPREVDARTAQTTLDSLGHFWSRHMAGSTLEPVARIGALLDAAVEQAHPAGSLRMGRDPATSVVDPALRVHALGNVQVASAAVFLSSGSANPTLTIMQLAMLAADELVARAGSARRR